MLCLFENAGSLLSDPAQDARLRQPEKFALILVHIQADAYAQTCTDYLP